MTEVQTSNEQQPIDTHSARLNRVSVPSSSTIPLFTSTTLGLPRQAIAPAAGNEPKVNVRRQVISQTGGNQLEC